MARPPRIPVRLADGQRDNPAAFQAIQTFCRENHNWQTIAAVVMPNHFHALIRPRQDRDARVTQFSAGLKRFVRSQTQAQWKWQDGVFDRLLRKNEFTESKWWYVRQNPVRAGLVRRWEDWPYLIGHEDL